MTSFFKIHNDCLFDSSWYYPFCTRPDDCTTDITNQIQAQFKVKAYCAGLAILPTLKGHKVAAGTLALLLTYLFYKALTICQNRHLQCPVSLFRAANGTIMLQNRREFSFRKATIFERTIWTCGSITLNIARLTAATTFTLLMTPTPKELSRYAFSPWPISLVSTLALSIFAIRGIQNCCKKSNTKNSSTTHHVSVGQGEEEAREDDGYIPDTVSDSDAYVPQSPPRHPPIDDLYDVLD
jgi:hypothetical protein